MLHTIQNDHLTVRAQTTGAELYSICLDGTEYLWQGDAAYWSDRSPTIFPYVARLTDEKYTYRGKTYSMPIHGFAPKAEFTLDSQTDTSMTFLLKSSEETLQQYPFQFRFYVTYAISGTTLTIRFRVENDDEKAMHFGLGTHPGINIPLEQGLSFTDYRLRFDPPCQPMRIGFTPDCFPNGNDKPYALQNGCELPLHHDLFDDDAIALREMSHTVTLESPKGTHGVTVHSPDQPIFGLWHMPKTDAPYVCLEAWSSLPSRKGMIEDLETQPDLIKLDAGKTYETAITLTLR